MSSKGLEILKESAVTLGGGLGGKEGDAVSGCTVLTSLRDGNWRDAKPGNTNDSNEDQSFQQFLSPEDEQYAWDSLLNQGGDERYSMFQS